VCYLRPLRLTFFSPLGERLEAVLGSISAAIAGLAIEKRRFSLSLKMVISNNGVPSHPCEQMLVRATSVVAHILFNFDQIAKALDFQRSDTVSLPMVCDCMKRCHSATSLCLSGRRAVWSSASLAGLRIVRSWRVLERARNSVQQATRSNGRLFLPQMKGRRPKQLKSRRARIPLERAEVGSSR